MTTIDSPTVINPGTPEEVYQKLSDLSNFEKLMPDTVQKFESDEGSFLFMLKGMPEVRLVMDEKVENQSLKLKSASTKIDFSLQCNLKPVEGGTQIDYHFEGDLNPMLKMMVTKPLTRFLGELAERSAKL